MTSKILIKFPLTSYRKGLGSNQIQQHFFHKNTVQTINNNRIEKLHPKYKVVTPLIGTKSLSRVLGYNYQERLVI